jgi:hypothetical protein
MITETDDIAIAIDLAAEVWGKECPERADLLRKLIAKGAEAVEAERQQKQAQRMAAVAELSSGKFDGIWPEGWYEEYKNEWPE